MLPKAFPTMKTSLRNLFNYEKNHTIYYRHIGYRSCISEVTTSPISGACKVTGCSGQICSDEDVITTCEYKEEFACYRTAKCERQANGQCGWTQTPTLQACLVK